MKKQHQRLKLCRKAIATLNDPMLLEIIGGNDLMFLNSKLHYCSPVRDTATVPAPTGSSLYGRCADTITICTDGKALINPGGQFGG